MRRDTRNNISEKSNYLTKNLLIKLRPQAKYNYQLIWMNYTNNSKGQEQQKHITEFIREVITMIIANDS